MRKLKLDELGRLSIDQYKSSEKNKIVLVMDNIRSAMNVGSFFRTADAFALEKIYLCGISATPPHREINKTALGADQAVEWAHFTTTREAIFHLKDEGYTIVGIEQTDKSEPLQNFIPDHRYKYALVFGNEVNGIEENILDHLDHCLEIPQFGTKHSLNVAVSGGVTIWHFMNAFLKSQQD